MADRRGRPGEGDERRERGERGGDFRRDRQGFQGRSRGAGGTGRPQGAGGAGRPQREGEWRESPQRGPRPQRDWSDRPRHEWREGSPGYERGGPERGQERGGPERGERDWRPRPPGWRGGPRREGPVGEGRLREGTGRDDPGHEGSARGGFGGGPGRGGQRGRPFGPPSRPPYRAAGAAWRAPDQQRESSPAPSPPRHELLAEGEELVAGRRPVEEAFAARREARRLLVVPERRAALDALVLHATTMRIPIVEVEGGTLTSLAGFDGHQGVALALASRPSVDLDDVLARAREHGQPPLVLVLDSLEDPQNLGTLLRSAEACGVHGVIFPTRRSAPLSPAAIKASAGATEHLLLVAVDDLPGTLVDLRARGLRLIGADEGAPLRYGEADMRGPLALVVGSEERGISGALRRRLDMAVRIPMRGRVASLNAAVAGSVLLFAAAEQRGAAETGEGGGPLERADTPPTAPTGPDDLAQPTVPKRRASRKPRADSAPEAQQGDAPSTSSDEELLPG